MTQDEIIEMARQAGFKMENSAAIQAAEAFAKLVAAKAIAELESQELKQVTVKDFVHIVESKEDLIGRPVYFAQWPNGNAHPPQRTWVGLTDEEATEVYTETQEKVNAHWESGGTTMMFPPTLYKAIEAKLREKNT